MGRKIAETCLFRLPRGLGCSYHTRLLRQHQPEPRLPKGTAPARPPPPSGRSSPWAQGSLGLCCPPVARGPWALRTREFLANTIGVRLNLRQRETNAKAQKVEGTCWGSHSKSGAVSRPEPGPPGSQHFHAQGGACPLVSD